VVVVVLSNRGSCRSISLQVVHTLGGLPSACRPVVQLQDRAQCRHVGTLLLSSLAIRPDHGHTRSVTVPGRVEVKVVPVLRYEDVWGSGCFLALCRSWR
jgi:hypothetical protein